jgi:hypothetical protein
MTDYPIPPVYPDLDLRDFPYMPLDVVRLRDSESVVLTTGEEFRAAVMLWCAAWHQVPASSLPNDDRILANLAGFGRDVKGWMEVKEGALRGFYVCADGKLYHSVIAEKATEADNKRKLYAERAKAGANARWKDKQSSSDAQALLADAKGREGKGIEVKEEKKEIGVVATATHPSDSAFDDFWKAYPKRDGANPKAPARKLFIAAVKSGVDPPSIVSGAQQYATECRAKQQLNTPYVAQAMTWLRQQRWGDYGSQATERLPAITNESPSWCYWRDHFVKTGQDFKIKLMDQCVADSRPFTVPSEFPPGMQAA